MKFEIGDQVEVLYRDGYSLTNRRTCYGVGDFGVIVGFHTVDYSGMQHYFVQFSQLSDAFMGGCNPDWKGGDLGVWSVSEDNLSLMIRITAPEPDADKGWVPDTAAENIMDLTRGMFE